MARDQRRKLRRRQQRPEPHLQQLQYRAASLTCHESARRRRIRQLPGRGGLSAAASHTQAIQDVGGRYRPIAPYIQDNWQVSPKLTLNLGLRYDYLQPYHEVKDRIAFLDVHVINPIVGIPGVLEYAGFPNYFTTPVLRYAPYICHCTTPVHPYNKNFEPRLGFAYAYTPTTVFSGRLRRPAHPRRRRRRRNREQRQAPETMANLAQLPASP